MFSSIFTCLKPYKTFTKCITYEFFVGIITNEDINSESNYLIALNKDLYKLKKEEVYEIAKVSLIKEKIKKNEIEKYVNIQNLDNDELINDIIKIL